MEGLNKLKELEYLNLAVNSVSKIEGVKRCESLNKLDLTLNFIDVEDLKESCENLEFNYLFTDLYLTGTPCLDWTGCRDYVIAKVETLLRLDGTEITKSERLKAKTKLPDLEIELEKLAAANKARKEFEKKEGKITENYTREQRWQDYCEEEARKKKAEEDR
jgi:protein TilB